MRRISYRSGLVRGRRAGSAFGALAGTALGILLGLVTIATVAAVAVGNSDAPTPDVVDGAHVPPLLTLPSEPITLRYAIVCPPPGGDLESGAPCDGSGDVYVRPGQAGRFTKLALRRGDDAREGRYFVDVPASIASSPTGFSYYAILRNNATGTSITLPAAGAAAPQLSLPLARPVSLDLPEHVFGAGRRATERVVAAPWGRRVGEAGLSGGRQVGFAGPSTFDVTADGTIVLLDQVNGRLQRWAPGARAASPVRIDVSEAIAELSVGPDGAAYVLQPAPRAGGAPELWSFGPLGNLLGRTTLSDRTWGAMRMGPEGPEVQQLPSEQWMPVRAQGRLLDPLAQTRGGRAGRTVSGGREVVVLRTGAYELRLALVGAGRILSGWRIVGATPLGEVQLAEPLGTRMVVVFKTYTEDQDEFVVLVLDGTGIVKSFSLPSAQWAEAAPLSRFRLHGTSLLQLGSTAQGMFIDRFELEERE